MLIYLPINLCYVPEKNKSECLILIFVSKLKEVGFQQLKFVNQFDGKCLQLLNSTHGVDS